MIAEAVRIRIPQGIAAAFDRALEALREPAGLNLAIG
jgi:hypothetical protein